MKIVENMQRLLRLQMRAAGDEMTAVALVDRRGDVVCLAGAMSKENATQLTALALHRITSDGFDEDLFDGEVMSLMLDGRAIAVGSAKRQLLVIAVLRECEGTDGTPTPQLRARARIIRDIVADMLPEEPSEPPPIAGDGSGGSGPVPAELQLIELGITVPRVRPKA